MAAQTWGEGDGVMMMDYSSQQPGERKGKHVTSIETGLFRAFMRKMEGIEADIMLEIKDKEASALQAVAILRELERV